MDGLCVASTGSSCCGSGAALSSSSAALHISIEIHTEATAVQPSNEFISDAERQQYGIETNLLKLLALPWEQCPWPAVRLRMLRLAIEGAEIYAYRPAFSKNWVIWYPLDGENAHKDGRMSPREWAILHGYAVPEIETTGQEGA